MGTLLAVAPLGVWTVIHLWRNLYAFVGADAWQAQVTEYPSVLAEVVTAFVVLAPLVFHAVWGLGRIVVGRPNTTQYRYYANLKFFLQRFSALGVLAFLGAHIWLASIKPRLTLGRAEPFADIAHEMRFHTPTLVVYLLGTLGVAYHLANGLQTAGMKFGFGWSRRPGSPLERPYLILFVILLAMSWGTIFALWRAGV
jgi:succinate dehydrogenase / fumarate reductase cytochrome b subunit